jgi:hypothetical protein
MRIRLVCNGRATETEVEDMPTEEFKQLLDRDGAIATAAPLIDAASPLLRELVNHACWHSGAARRSRIVEAGKTRTSLR